jgi:exodeoxyribonuclease III
MDNGEWRILHSPFSILHSQLSIQRLFMKIATWNVNGIRARQEQVLAWIQSVQPDIVCLQELKAMRVQVPESLTTLPEYWSYWHGERAYSGVGLLVKRSLIQDEPVFEHPDFDFETRIVTVRIDKTIIGSVYVPNGGKDYAAKLRFLEAMQRYAMDCQSQGLCLILCGDMNVTRNDLDVHPKERKPDVIGQRPDERALFEKILVNGGMTDIGRALDPDNDRMFTWWPPWRGMREKNIGWRLDFILTSGIPMQSVTQCSVLAQTGTSDHAPVIAEIL